VPSQSRPGAFSYLHVPTGFKQADLPTSAQPGPQALAALAAQQQRGARARAHAPPADEAKIMQQAAQVLQRSVRKRGLTPIVEADSGARPAVKRWHPPPPAPVAPWQMALQAARARQAAAPAGGPGIFQLRRGGS